ncbi:hypothetical protein O6H91_14G014700 [Diphasiastrum complanatum]|uniref:Uncharacterized protein n=2 Tax=Diphasiastrum complanatum TaxID=34168 RepID=A0ACC2BLP0_DIPCM|nr:hypothetical protein O6H91_14G010200 [Diphasiastrum complanatum]KAJ7530683.1 hypothetical protein O6H91_14G014700 [Diphasiastrum complanatum]
MARTKQTARLTSFVHPSHPQTSEPVRPQRCGRPSRSWLRDIRALQRSTKFLIPKAAFYRAVREVTQDMTTHLPYVVRWNITALEALHTTYEDSQTKLFEDSMMCSIHGKRVTLMPKDMLLVMRLQNTYDSIFKFGFT